MEFPLIKILLPATLAFVIGICITPIITRFLYKYKVWKKSGGKVALDGSVAEEFNRLKMAEEVRTPRMGGIVIWSSVLLTIATIYVCVILFPTSLFSDIFFLSRAQTWLPIAALVVGALVGFLNDYYDVTHTGRGLSLRVRLGVITLLAGSIGWWFYAKVGVSEIGLPFFDPLYVGILLVPFFILMTIGIYASGVIDGIDGLSGGVFTAVFLSYSGVAYIQSQYDLAALCATIAGAILAFLWFNIPPARFWMTETGSMALTLSLSVVVLMTDQIGDGYGISLFFVIGLPLVATVASNVLQISYKRATGKKLFRIAPLHHHFEAIGWSSAKVTMRYWVISAICAILGMALTSLLVS
jgi:phospho-N-acetylmuramoyl-pentapeptide-transferase